MLASQKSKFSQLFFSAKQDLKYSMPEESKTKQSNNGKNHNNFKKLFQSIAPKKKEEVKNYFPKISPKTDEIENERKLFADFLSSSSGINRMNEINISLNSLVDIAKNFKLEKKEIRKIDVVLRTKINNKEYSSERADMLVSGYFYLEKVVANLKQLSTDSKNDVLIQGLLFDFVGSADQCLAGVKARLSMMISKMEYLFTKDLAKANIIHLKNEFIRSLIQEYTLKPGYFSNLCGSARNQEVHVVQAILNGLANEMGGDVLEEGYAIKLALKEEWGSELDKCRAFIYDNCTQKTFCDFLVCDIKKIFVDILKNHDAVFKKCSVGLKNKVYFDISNDNYEQAINEIKKKYPFLKEDMLVVKDPESDNEFYYRLGFKKISIFFECRNFLKSENYKFIGKKRRLNNPSEFLSNEYVPGPNNSMQIKKNFDGVPYIKILYGGDRQPEYKDIKNLIILPGESTAPAEPQKLQNLEENLVPVEVVEPVLPAPLVPTSIVDGFIARIDEIEDKNILFLDGLEAFNSDNFYQLGDFILYSQHVNKYIENPNDIQQLLSVIPKETNINLALDFMEIIATLSENEDTKKWLNKIQIALINTSPTKENASIPENFPDFVKNIAYQAETTPALEVSSNALNQLDTSSDLSYLEYYDDFAKRLFSESQYKTTIASPFLKISKIHHETYRRRLSNCSTNELKEQFIVQIAQFASGKFQFLRSVLNGVNDIRYLERIFFKKDSLKYYSKEQVLNLLDIKSPSILRSCMENEENISLLNFYGELIKNKNILDKLTEDQLVELLNAQNEVGTRTGLFSSVMGDFKDNDGLYTSVYQAILTNINILKKLSPKSLYEILLGYREAGKSDISGLLPTHMNFFMKKFNTESIKIYLDLIFDSRIRKKFLNDPLYYFTLILPCYSYQIHSNSQLKNKYKEMMSPLCGGNFYSYVWIPIYFLLDEKNNITIDDGYLGRLRQGDVQDALDDLLGHPKLGEHYKQVIVEIQRFINIKFK